MATLARSVERGRALAAARNAQPVPVTKQIVQEIPEPPAPAQAFVSNLFLSEVAELVHFVKCHDSANLDRSECVLSTGTTFGDQAGDSKLFVQVVAHIAAATVPHSELQYLRSGQVTPLAKPTGRQGPLLMMSFLRRLALKSVMAAKRESVAKCAGPLCSMEGRPDGANTMIKTIEYLAEADTSRVLVARANSGG